MHSLECFIAIINCNLYIKTRKTVRPIHLWAIINMVMTSLTTSHKLPNRSRALKQFHNYLLNLFSISTCVFLGWAQAWLSNGVFMGVKVSCILEALGLCLSCLLRPFNPPLNFSFIFPHDTNERIKKTQTSLFEGFGWFFCKSQQNLGGMLLRENLSNGHYCPHQVPLFEEQAFLSHLC